MVNNWRSLARRVIPLEFRQTIAQVRRVVQDRRAGMVFDKKEGGETWPVRIELAQTVMPSALLANKLANIQRGVFQINSSLLEAGGYWSFWGRVGRPSAANGYVEGRNLVDGRLTRQVGGGLCQLSSLIYYLALQSGMDIVERHSHSIDIYREDERYTPLGADATVTWGFKDLRIHNPFSFAVSIGCVLEGVHLRGQLRCAEPLPACELAFVRENLAADLVSVKTVVNGTARWHSVYERRPAAETGVT